MSYLLGFQKKWILVALLLFVSMEATDHSTIRFYNGRLLRNHKLKTEELWIADGKIVPPQSRAGSEIDVKGLIVAPGYIDLQINGGFGIDFSKQPEGVTEVAKRLPEHGVTAFLPTLVSLSQKQYLSVLESLKSKIGCVKRGAAILGIHLEGPFFNPNKCGAHKISSISEYSPETFYGSLEGVSIVTLAPEMPGAIEAIEALQKRGIIAAIGHSNATYQQMEEAVEKGARLVTHLFNAMTPFHHRNPGIVGMTLTHPSLFYSIIADGHHLHPASINLAWRSHPHGLVLITDAIEGLGLTAGTYHLGNKVVEVKDGKALIAQTETIAGSVIPLDAAVRYFRKSTGCTAVDALEAASLKPAQVLGIENKKGTLQVGADADFIFLDDELNVHKCFIRGDLVN